ncbi:MAG: sigma factor-like helix-turn-helix DNA-binding protein [Nitriliruptoraceae bacterium]
MGGSQGKGRGRHQGQPGGAKSGAKGQQPSKQTGSGGGKGGSGGSAGKASPKGGKGAPAAKGRKPGKGQKPGTGGKGSNPAEELKQPLERVLSRLPATQRRVLELRMGLTDGHPHDLADTARTLGLSLSEARDIEKRAFEHIREAVPLHQLQRFLQG